MRRLPLSRRGRPDPSSARPARRRSLVGLGTLLSFVAFGCVCGASPALAHVTPCTVTSLPSFIAQGEFTHVSSVADVISVSCEPAVQANKPVFIGSEGLSNRCKHTLVWAPVSTATPGPKGQKGVKVVLDSSGNASVVVWGGPSCAAGESLIEVHTEDAPFETYTTDFTIEEPQPTVEGVTVLPSSATESATDGAVATIVQAEFSPIDAEAPIGLSAGGLFSACLFKPKLRWFGADAELLAEGTESVSKVELDNDGNAFAVLFALPSCAPGEYPVQANLEEVPFTTFFTEFDIAPPPVPGPTELAYTGPLTVAHGDPFLASAKLTVPAGGIAEGRQITFVLGPNAGESCTAETSVSGEAQCSLTPSQTPGPAKITATFAGSPELAPVEAASPVTITADETKLSYIGATMAQYRHPFIAAAKLEDPDGATPLAGKKITFTLGKRGGKSATHGKHCTATTSALGIAECPLKPAQAGVYPIAASFNGDAEDEPSSASATVTVEAPESACTVSSLPSFVDQGEFGETSSIADIVRVACSPMWAERHVEISAAPLYIECAEHLSWAAPNAPTALRKGPSFNVELDDDGNATAVLWGGPSCAAGTALISAHLLAPPFTTVTTDLQVLPPQPTPEGLQALPASEIEDSTYSSVATIVEIEFSPRYAEQNVNVDSVELYNGCIRAPHVVWIGPDETLLGEGRELTATVKLDNDGNAFVVLFGAQSCAPGEYLIQASLESPPFTTLITSFTIEPPQTTL